MVTDLGVEIYIFLSCEYMEKQGGFIRSAGPFYRLTDKYFLLFQLQWAVNIWCDR